MMHHTFALSKLIKTVLGATILLKLLTAQAALPLSPTYPNPIEPAIQNPEYVLDHWIEMPVSPETKQEKPLSLSLREAILLALRYNPNIQNAELDRIIQRYQLRLAHNAYELQYALSGVAAVQKSRYTGGMGSSQQHSLLATPQIDLKNQLGTSLSLGLDNNVSNYDNYSPALNFSLTQPLLRGFGRQVNEAPLKTAEDNEQFNKILLRQTVSDQITQVIIGYRNLVLSGHNLLNQKRQLQEAKQTFQLNKKRIAAGQLERTANVQQSYQIESIHLSLEQSENDFAIASQNLLQLIGLDPNRHLLIPNQIDITQEKIPTQKEAIRLALKNNSQYLAQLLRMRADERAYQIAKNQQLWELDLTAGIQSGRVSDVNRMGNGLPSIYNGQNTNEFARLTLNIPIHDLNRKNQLITAKVALEKDRLSLIAAKRQLITLVTNTLSNIQSLAKRYHLAEKQVALAEQSYALEKKKQQAGIASALEVNQTQNQLIQAQAALISSKITYLNQISELQRTLGTTLDHWNIQLRYGQ